MSFDGYFEILNSENTSYSFVFIEIQTFFKTLPSDNCFIFVEEKNIMNEEQKKQGNQINIELTEEIADGIYSNLAIISHSQSEFILDFVRILPGVNKAKVKSRIILTPQHAKRLFKALGENIEKFETINGEIEDNDTLPGMPMNFGGNTAQA